MYIDLNYALRQSLQALDGRPVTLAEILAKRVSRVLPHDPKNPNEMSIIRSLAQKDDIRHLYSLAEQPREAIERLYGIDGANFLETGLRYYGLNFSTVFENHLQQLMDGGFSPDEYHDYRSCVGYYAKAVQDRWREEENRKKGAAIARLAGITGLPLPQNEYRDDTFVKMSFAYCRKLLEAFKASR